MKRLFAVTSDTGASEDGLVWYCDLFLVHTTEKSGKFDEPLFCKRDSCGWLELDKGGKLFREEVVKLGYEVEEVELEVAMENPDWDEWDEDSEENEDEDDDEHGFGTPVPSSNMEEVMKRIFGGAEE